MTKREYANQAITEFKKLGKIITNTQILGNQKNLFVLVGCREKSKSDAIKRLQSIAYRLEKLTYVQASDDGEGKSKSGYYHYVAVFKVER